MDARLREDMERRAKLAMALTNYDRKQAAKAGYNRYALPQYFDALDRALDLVARGTTLRRALVQCFTGRLLAIALRAVDEQPPTDRELRGWLDEGRV